MLGGGSEQSACEEWLGGRCGRGIYVWPRAGVSAACHRAASGWVLRLCRDGLATALLLVCPTPHHPDSLPASRTAHLTAATHAHARTTLTAASSSRPRSTSAARAVCTRSTSSTVTSRHSVADGCRQRPTLPTRTPGRGSAATPRARRRRRGRRWTLESPRRWLPTTPRGSNNPRTRLYQMAMSARKCFARQCGHGGVAVP